jgi:hypothetical protein
VANRPAAMPPAHETHGLSGSTTPVPVARIGVPLLLKTILLHPVAASEAPMGRIPSSIARQEGCPQRAHKVRIIWYASHAYVKRIRKPPFHSLRVVSAMVISTVRPVC